tara:strand:+ start:365 stop:826 length:462 start_codon:yes stop_codon:yes gene_type:complete
MITTTPSLSPVQGDLSAAEIKAECRQLRRFIETTEAQEFPVALGYHKMQLIESAEMRHYLLLEEFERIEDERIDKIEIKSMRVGDRIAAKQCSWVNRGTITAIKGKRVSVLMDRTTTGAITDFSLRNDGRYVAVGYSKDEGCDGGYFHSTSNA